MTRRRSRREGEIMTAVPSGTQGNQTLYTVPDDRRETFVGLKGNFQFTPSGTVSGDIGVIVHHQRRNTAAPVMSVSGSSIISDRLQDVLWSYMFNVDSDVDDIVFGELDIKSMRKLDEGDVIMVSSLGSASGIGEFNGNANMFFKEAS